MKRLGFTVGHCFVMPGLGLTLFPHVGQFDHELRIGDALELRRPDGSVLQTSAVCLSPVHANPTPFMALVFPDWSASEVPIGTEVWVTDAEQSAAADPAA